MILITVSKCITIMNCFLLAAGATNAAICKPCEAGSYSAVTGWISICYASGEICCLDEGPRAMCGGEVTHMINVTCIFLKSVESALSEYHHRLHFETIVT